MSYDYLFKLIFIGDTNVGKTAITDRLIHDRYLGRYDNTIGVDFASVNTVINNKDRIKTHIWDTAGQEQCRLLAVNRWHPKFRRLQPRNPRSPSGSAVLPKPLG